MRLFVPLIIFITLYCETHAAALEFRGFISASGTYRFLIADLDDGTSEWLSLGAAFNGYKVVRFDPREDILTVQSDDQTLNLSLRTARVKSTKSDEDVTFIPAAVTIGVGGNIAIDGEEVALERLISMLFDRMAAGQGNAIHVKTVPGEKAAETIKALRSSEGQFAGERWVLRTFDGPADGLVWKLGLFKVPRR